MEIYYLIFYIGLLATILKRTPLSGITIASIEITRIGIGAVFIYISAGIWFDAIIILSCILLFTIGCYSGYSLTDGRTKPDTERKFLNSFGLFSAVFFVALGSLYHYTVVGVPLFAADYNEARFSVSESGLFGIPSRIATYGPTFLSVLSLYILLRNGNEFSKTVIAIGKFSLALCFILFVLKGHKSSILSLILVFMIMIRFTNKKYNKKYKYIALIAGIMSLIFSVYWGAEQQNPTGGDGFLSYFYTRVFFSGPDALVVGINLASDADFYSNALLSEIIYPFTKLMGSDSKLYVIALSHELYNVPISDFTVPVTPSIIAPAINDFGYAFSHFIVFIFGFALGTCVAWTKKMNSLPSVFLFVGLEILLYQGIARGAPFYTLINGGIFLFVMWALTRIKIS